MNSITAAIARHPAQKTALISGSHRLTYGELAQKMVVPSNTDAQPAANRPTFDPSLPVVDAVLDALRQLHQGCPIVGTTSGSTGAAKFYERSQASWLASFAADQQEFGLVANDIIVAPGSLAHSLFSYAVCHGLFLGATVVLSEEFRPDRVLQQIREHQATVLYAVPTQLKLLLAAATRTDRHRDEGNLNPLPSIRWVLSSGSRWFSEITSDLQRLFPKTVIGEFYGASELSYVSVAKHGLDPNLPRGSVGRAFSGVDIQIIDQKIWVHSEGLFTRYCVSHPADFSERTDEEGRRWLSVGDLGVMDTNGYLFLSGRESRKIIVSGKNLYPEEVEEAIESHPWVQRAAVLSRPDAVRGERLLAMIQPRELLDQTSDDSPLSGERLRQTLIEHLRPLLEDFKIPRDYRLVMNWPTTPTGKTNFAALGKAIN